MKFTKKVAVIRSNGCPTVAIKCRHDDRCECNYNTNWKKCPDRISGSEQDWNP